MRTYDYLIVHHSASPRSTTLEDIDQWHRERGWLGIGYNYVIEETGLLRVGRPFAALGSHTKGYNQSSIGICVTGDNTDADEEWAESQIGRLLNFIYSFQMLFPNAQVVGHRDLNPGTECPGVDIEGLLTL